MKKVNLKENCPYFDRENRQCCRNGCHLLTPCIAFNNNNNYKGIIKCKTKNC